MSNSGTGVEDPNEAFDLGESEVRVRKAPRGRSAGRIAAAGAPTAVGCLFFVPGLLFLTGPLLGFASGLLNFGVARLASSGVAVSFLSIASAFFGLGFAIYDYRWPFGHRPGGLEAKRRDASGQKVRGPEDY